jgi:fumarate reductase flavoprotein subunit
MSHLGPEIVTAKFRGMVRRCADCGFDLAGGLVEVVPTAHYFMGGVVVDPDTRTGMPGLYVAGEDAGGAHGANRLGGNGVANSTVYGGVAGDVIGADVAGAKGALHDADPAAVEAEVARALAPLERPAGDVHGLRAGLMDAMWEDVGVMRTAEGLARGLERITAIRAELHATGIAGGGLAYNLTWHDWLNLQSLVETSEVIARAAIARENSRGAHYREDFPEVGDLDASYFTVARQHSDGLAVTREPVVFTIVRPGETILKDSVEAAE